MKKLLKLIESVSGKRIAVWGDFLLDRYIYAYAERLSREAPVPILKFERERYDLGGAGNTAKNITSLGGEAYAIGITGKDEKPSA